MRQGRSFIRNATLSVGHVAGMIDMIALPLWVGVLIRHYDFNPAQAGEIVTVFLLGVVSASLVAARLLDRLSHRFGVVVGFALAAVTFTFIARLQTGTDFALMAGLHALAGFGAGFALSITHGNIGRTENPHRLFGIVNVALGVVGVLTFALVPPLTANVGPAVIFWWIAGIMAIGCVVCAGAFPRNTPTAGAVRVAPTSMRMPLNAWLIVLVVMCMTFNQAMVFSFLDQLGNARGFSATSINGVLIALGVINLIPGGLAAALQSRVSPLAVGFAGPIVQAGLALILANATSFMPFAIGGAFYVSVVIFTHTFLFGLLSRLDGSGRGVAGTPAMMMSGSCAGPAVGGLIVSNWGYQGLGWAAALVAMVAVGLFLTLRLRLQARPPVLASI